MRRKPPHSGETPWASFSDALSGMLFVFILTTFWFAWQLKQAEAEMKKAEAETKQQLTTLTSADAKAKELVGTVLDPGELTRCLQLSGVVGADLDATPQTGEARISLYMKGVEWFAEGDAALGKEQRRATERIRACLESLVRRTDLETYTISVSLEGHTDMVPLPPAADYETNWELSGARAAAVLREVLPEGDLTGSVSALRDQESTGRLRILAVGMADRQPVWQRLCLSPSAEDAKVCSALEGSISLKRTDRARAWRAALLEGLEGYQARWADCSPRPTPLTPAEAEQKTPLELLRLWANRCPSGTTDNNDRRGLLRRVDLRLELDPILPPTPQATASPP